MSIADGKCPNCGANIKIDTDKDAGICEYCGSAFVTEKAIINYGTYINKQENNTYHKKQDNEYSVELKKLEMEKEKRNDKFFIGLAIFVIAAFMFLMIRTVIL